MGPSPWLWMSYHWWPHYAEITVQCTLSMHDMITLSSHFTLLRDQNRVYGLMCCLPLYILCTCKFSVIMNFSCFPVMWLCLYKIIYYSLRCIIISMLKCHFWNLNFRLDFKFSGMACDTETQAYIFVRKIYACDTETQAYIFVRKIYLEHAWCNHIISSLLSIAELQEQECIIWCVISMHVYK